jgi:Fe-S oxidoreductase
MKVATIAELSQSGRVPEVLFWVGCAGSFDVRAQKISRAFSELLQNADISFGILGNEESCTGDPARRAGNEFVFQMMAIQNIETLNNYDIKKIVTTCPHCFNTLKNEYPVLGGKYEVFHHTEFISKLIEEGRIRIKKDNDLNITYHDSCYIGRINGIYEVPRKVLEEIGATISEMPRCKSKGLCCGAGGAQMFKEDEPGEKRINSERVEEIVNTKQKKVVANCPFCITMLQDGIKEKEMQNEIMVYDLAELVLNNIIT